MLGLAIGVTCAIFRQLLHIEGTRRDLLVAMAVARREAVLAARNPLSSTLAAQAPEATRVLRPGPRVTLLLVILGLALVGVPVSGALWILSAVSGPPSWLQDLAPPRSWGWWLRRRASSCSWPFHGGASPPTGVNRWCMWLRVGACLPRCDGNCGGSHLQHDRCGQPALVGSSWAPSSRQTSLRCGSTGRSRLRSLTIGVCPCSEGYSASQIAWLDGSSVDSSGH